jgi:hypothetical protein
MKRILTTLLLISMALPASAMAPGTVLEGNALSAQYTVSALPTAANFTLPNVSMPDPALFKEKGLPVIISFACGKAPWWALATGTGYVLIQELDVSSCQLYCSLASGSSYAIGEAISNMVTNKNYNKYVHCALQACLATSCACVNFACNNDMLKSASTSMLTAIGFNMLGIISSMIFEAKKEPCALIAPPQLTYQERIKKINDEHPLDGYNMILKPYLVAGSIVFGGIALATPAAYSAAIAYLKNYSFPTQTVLTESAYRLSKKACDWYANRSDVKTTSEPEKN